MASSSRSVARATGCYDENPSSRSSVQLAEAGDALSRAEVARKAG
jgi:hypothetical protein